MGETVNLRLARKRRERAAADAKAAANRAKFGEGKAPKAARTAEAARVERVHQALKHDRET